MPSRITSPSRRRALYLILVAGAVGGIVNLGFLIGSRLSANTTSINTACVQVHKLELVIRGVLVRTLNTFGEKGTSGYAYYLAHPAELAAGRVALENEIREFSSSKC